MGSSKQKTQTQQSSRTDPWGPAAGPIQQSIPNIDALYNQRLRQQFFPGQTYAGFDPSQERALRGVEATAGHGLTAAAKDYTGKVLGGHYLNADTNPYIMEVARRAAGDAQARTAAQWGAAGRGYGNSDVVGATARATSEAALPFLSQNYQNERAIMEAATGRANALDYADYDRLYAAGQQRQMMGQNAINEAMLRYQFEQERQANALKEKLGLLTPLAQLGNTSSGTSTSTTTSTPSPMQVGVGLGMTALGAMGGMPGLGMAGMGAMGGMGGMGMGLGAMSGMGLGGAYYAPDGTMYRR